MDVKKPTIVLMNVKKPTIVLMNVKKPTIELMNVLTIVGILTFISRIHYTGFGDLN